MQSLIAFTVKQNDHVLTGRSSRRYLTHRNASQLKTILTSGWCVTSSQRFYFFASVKEESFTNCTFNWCKQILQRQNSILSDCVDISEYW